MCFLKAPELKKKNDLALQEIDFEYRGNLYSTTGIIFLSSNDGNNEKSRFIKTFSPLKTALVLDVPKYLPQVKRRGQAFFKDEG